MPGPNAVMSAQLLCSFGIAPSSLIVPPASRVTIEGKPAATIMSNIPLVNVPPFGMCMSLSNPQVVAATTAALGVLTPVPCQPVIPGPWVPGAPRTMVGGQPALTAGSTCVCVWGGVITITNPGAVKTTSS